MTYEHPPGTLVDTLTEHSWIRDTRGVVCSYEEVLEMHGPKLASIKGATWARWGVPEGDGILFSRDNVTPLYTTTKVKVVNTEKPYDPTQQGDQDDDI